jgi:hypothetical protein
VTDDLVKRLNMVDATMNPMTLVIVAREAADRIEQLEAALQGLFDNFLELHAKEGCDCDDCEAVRFARAALGEKKDG